MEGQKGLTSCRRLKAAQAESEKRRAVAKTEPNDEEMKSELAAWKEKKRETKGAQLQAQKVEKSGEKSPQLRAGLQRQRLDEFRDAGWSNVGRRNKRGWGIRPHVADHRSPKCSRWQHKEAAEVMSWGDICAAASIPGANYNSSFSVERSVAHERPHTSRSRRCYKR